MIRWLLRKLRPQRARFTVIPVTEWMVLVDCTGLEITNTDSLDPRGWLPATGGSSTYYLPVDLGTVWNDCQEPTWRITTPTSIPLFEFPHDGPVTAGERATLPDGFTVTLDERTP